jgi:hypothetical protein
MLYGRRILRWGCREFRSVGRGVYGLRSDLVESVFLRRGVWRRFLEVRFWILILVWMCFAVGGALRILDWGDLVWIVLWMSILGSMIFELELVFQSRYLPVLGISVIRKVVTLLYYIVFIVFTLLVF